MKNLIFFFLLLSFSATGQENETSNKYILGGGIFASIFSQETPEQEITNPVSTTTTIQNGLIRRSYDIVLRPYFGFQLNQRSLFGLRGEIDFSGSSTIPVGFEEFTSRIRSFGYGAGAFYRFYINPNNKFKIFLQPSTNLSVENITRDSFAPSLEEQRLIEFDAGIGLGATYQIAKKWNLIVNIWNASYLYSDFRAGSQTESTIRSFVSANFSLSNVFFGAEYLF